MTEKTRAVNDDEPVFLAWNDPSGLTRGRGVPASELSSRLERGINWAYAGHALTPFGDIADNPWGPVGEAHMTPAPDTGVRVAFPHGEPPLHFFLCDGLNPDGSTWDSCTRAFLKNAVEDLRTETGLTIVTGIEVEFHLERPDSGSGPPFSLDAFRLYAEIGQEILRALREAGAEPETFEPEYGVGQFEVSCGPAEGVAGGDRIVILREVIRDVARRMGARASFTPMVRPGVPGNGAHLHFSLRDGDGRSATHDPDRPGDLSETAGRFAAGVLRHAGTLCALTAPSVVSYERLRPHFWSSAYACLGQSNREASLRICEPPKGSPEDVARRYHLEYRPTDSTCCPYIALGAIIRAGLEGLREKLDPPTPLAEDPDEIGADRRAQLGVRRLPESLEEALAAMESDERAKAWFPGPLRQVLVNIKRKEIELMQDRDAADICARYRDVY